MQALAVRIPGRKNRKKPPVPVFVDDDVFDRLARWNWRFANATGHGVPVREVYRPGVPGHKPRTLAREVVGLPQGDPRRVVRLDSTRLDYTRANLRIVAARPPIPAPEIEHS